MTSLKAILFASSFLSSTTGYSLKSMYNATNFLDNNSFTFIDNWDVYNKGMALFTCQNEAMSSGLARITDEDKIYLGVDSNTKLDNTTVGSGISNGRKSIRLESQQTINNGLVIADFDHLPSKACGQWPAFWLLNDGATYSEIDIVENVSLETVNEISMYTNPDTCTMTDNHGTGVTRNVDCRLHKPELATAHACGAEAAPGTFGDSFNGHNGGIWATQIESDGIKVWQFPRGSEPSDIHSSNPNPAGWSKPILDFGPGNCDITSAFKNMKIIINVSLCGNWAGSDEVWSTETKCAATTGYNSCDAYVADNPDAFKDVYFLINEIKVFQ